MDFTFQNNWGGYSLCKITVLMPLYNREEFVGEAISSILNQSFEDFELLIINDGSTDSSFEIAKNFKDSRIKLVNNSENIKLIKTLNKGILLAEGEYIARMDSDDIAEKDRLLKQVEFMEMNPDISVCGTWIKEFSRDIKKGNEVNHPISPKQLHYKLMFDCALVHPSVMIRKCDLVNNGILYDEKYPHAEDFNMWNDMVLNYGLKVSNIPITLLYYRLTEDGISRKKRHEQLETGAKIRKRIFDKYNISVDTTLFYEKYLSVDELIKLEKSFITLYQRLIREALDENEIDIIEEIINQEWYKYANRATLSGLKTWSKYKTSKLHRNKLFKKKEFKLFIKCLTKYKLRNI
jgi:glycosyltransferase involved in cell wall biosynthesis